MSKRIFFIAGMHRSGTSYLAETLSFLGLELPNSIQPGGKDNPKGHFESFNITQYLDGLLAELGMSWDTFISIPDGWFSSEYAEKATQELCDKLHGDFTGDGPALLKDPRLSLFFPIFKDIVDVENLNDFYIIPLRHPVEVAASLGKRNRISTYRSYLVWLNYLFNAEKNSRGKKRSFINFPDWTQDIEQTIEKIEHDLGTKLPSKHKKNLILAKNEFESSLVHHNCDRFNEASNDIEILCFNSYKIFLKLINDPSDKGVLTEIDKLRVQFETISTVYAEIVVELEINYGIQKMKQASLLQQQLDVSAGEVARLEQQFQASQQVEAGQAEQMGQLQQQLDVSMGEVARLEQQFQASQQVEAGQAEQMGQLQQQLDVSMGEVARLEQEFQTSQQVEAGQAEQVSQLQQQLDVSMGEVARLEQEFQASQQVEAGHREQAAKLEQQLQREINELKVQCSSLAKEYEQLLNMNNKEKFTVFRPIHRNLYRKSGLILRKVFPASFVESIKKLAPHPSGVPKQLTYQPQLLKNTVVSVDEFLRPAVESISDVFVLSIINWDFRYQRPQHIAKGLADAGRRVFYIEMDLVGKETQIIKVTNNLFRVKLPSKNIGHIQPYTGQPSAEQNRAWVSAFYNFCDSINATSFKHIIIQHPYWWQLARHFSPEYKITFDCMDDISGFSNTEQFLLDLEHEMLQKCDCLVVSSQYLLDKYCHYQPPVLIRNAAELDHFDGSKREKISPLSIPLHSLSNRMQGTIRVGYVGAIAEWFDTDLVKKVSRLACNYEIHLCGAVTTEEAAQLAELKNVFMYGEIPYSDVPAFLDAMDVLIIPFKIIPIIQACDPVKFYEYSAMGKPTVTTALPELSRASKLAFFASTAQEFVDQISAAHKAAKKRNFRKQLQDYAANNTWMHRTHRFEEILDRTPMVTVIILAYGDPELTKAALHSIYDGGSVYPNLEVLIVDNGSSHDAVDEIKQFALGYADVRVIENGENLGFAKGNNVGLEAATGDYVMLLNNDTVVAPGAIFAMVCHLARNPAIGVVGPLTNNIGNEAKLFVEYESMSQMKDIARQATTGYRGMYSPIDVAAYFAVMFRKSDLNIFGLLSEEYGRGMFEDDDHCAMIKSKGYVCVLAEDAFVHHHLSATFSKLKVEEKEVLFEKNKKSFEKKWGTWRPHKYRETRPESSLSKQG